MRNEFGISKVENREARVFRRERKSQKFSGDSRLRQRRPQGESEPTETKCHSRYGPCQDFRHFEFRNERECIAKNLRRKRNHRADAAETQ